MATAARTAMTSDAQILTLAQWFSPAYPVGGFHFSHGLEWAISSGAVTGPDTLKDWIKHILDHGAGRNDALLLAAACKAETTDELDRIDATARALAASRERLHETCELGAAFARITGALLGRDLPALTYPVAIGHAARLAGLPAVLTAKMFLQSFLGSLAAVGMRLIPIGQTDGQRIIHRLTPLCALIAEATADGDLSQLSSTAFLADIAAMKHETQYSRIYRT